jgi:hypothetical protein
MKQNWIIVAAVAVALYFAYKYYYPYGFGQQSAPNLNGGFE